MADNTLWPIIDTVPYIGDDQNPWECKAIVFVDAFLARMTSSRGIDGVNVASTGPEEAF